ncbi:MAG TPA: GAF domain-containing protein [Cryomorphaceae bacterium]|nr:GAF domain-containing protein [Cryomorphaceae bacterium]
MDKQKLFKDHFPFKSELNFAKVIEFWESETQSPVKQVADYAKSVLELIKSEPALSQPILDRATIEKHLDKVELLLSCIFSRATWQKDLKGVVAAFDVDCFFETPQFNKIVNVYRNQSGFVAEDQHNETLYFQILGAYAAILDKYYNFPIERRPSRSISFEDPETGLVRFFHGHMNMDFVDIELTGELPELSEDDLVSLVNNYQDIDYWMKHLPADVFKFSGVSIINLVEITEQQLLSQLKADLLKPGALDSMESLRQIEEGFKSLMGDRETKISIAFYQQLRDKFVNLGTAEGTQQGLMDFKCGMDDNEARQMFEPLFENKENIILTSVCNADIDEDLKKKLLDFGINSVIVVPLISNNVVVGLFQLVSERANAFSSLDLLRFSELTPLLAMAVERVRISEENEVTRIIKEKFTSLHPAVEWKFQEVAIDYLDSKKDLTEKALDQVVFKDVYPLYGSSDVRNSSDMRNTCIQQDLTTQLDLVIEVLERIIEKHSFPIYKELEFEVKNHRQEVAEELLSDEEVKIVDFIKSEIEPLFRHIQANNDELAEPIAAYFDELDDEHQIIYKRRKHFEDSIEMINGMAFSLIEAEEEKTQKMFPYFFENYKTDGVEYNIYIGQSIAKKKVYNPIYLQNLRLWQLMLMCKVTRETHKILPKLPIALETAQLILVQSTALSIRFRTDEKKFDVDGAYNIRYEIMKKRIDKALIKDTNERLTQPHTVSVIFSLAKEEEEYMSYVKYLTHLNFIQPDVERFELQHMQGVSGLKAIRMTVNLSDNDVMEKAFEKEMQEVVGISIGEE